MAYEMERQVQALLEAAGEVANEMKNIDKLGFCLNSIKDPEAMDLIFEAMLVVIDGVKPKFDKLFEARREIAVLELREEMKEEEEEG